MTNCFLYTIGQLLSAVHFWFCFSQSVSTCAGIILFHLSWRKLQYWWLSAILDQSVLFLETSECITTVAILRQLYSSTFSSRQLAAYLEIYASMLRIGSSRFSTSTVPFQCLRLWIKNQFLSGKRQAVKYCIGQSWL